MVVVGIDRLAGLVRDPRDQSKLIEVYLGTQLGDADLDGQVDFADFLVLSARFGGAGVWADDGFDASGDVPFADFLILSNNFATEALAVAARAHVHSNSLRCGLLLRLSA